MLTKLRSVTYFVKLTLWCHRNPTWKTYTDKDCMFANRQIWLDLRILLRLQLYSYTTNIEWLTQLKTLQRSNNVNIFPSLCSTDFFVCYQLHMQVPLQCLDGHFHWHWLRILLFSKFVFNFWYIIRSSNLYGDSGVLIAL